METDIDMGQRHVMMEIQYLETDDQAHEPTNKTMFALEDQAYPKTLASSAAMIILIMLLILLDN